MVADAFRLLFSVAGPIGQFLSSLVETAITYYSPLLVIKYSNIEESSLPKVFIVHVPCASLRAQK